MADGLEGSRVYLAATLDTKAWHADVVAQKLRETGLRVCVVDCGTRTPKLSAAEIAGDAANAIERDELERRGGGTLADADRASRLAVMAAGLEVLISERVAAGDVLGFIALGGGTGANLAAGALRAIPFGTPSMLVSTSVTGDVEAIAGDTDIVLVQPGVDLVGHSEVVAGVLRRASAGFSAMVREAGAKRAVLRATVGITAFGVTSEAVDAVVERVNALGLDPIVFHARGSGGRTLERLVRDGLVDAVIDLTTTEIADEVLGGMRSAGPTRLDAALEGGIPLVIAPGALDVLNFAARNTVPDAFAGRRILAHTPTTTLVRTDADDNRRIAEWIAPKLISAPRPDLVRVLIPTRGFSALDVQGGPFFDQEADAVFAGRLAQLAGDRVEIDTVDLHLCDPGFADLLVDALRTLLEKAAGVAPRSNYQQEGAPTR